MKVSLGRQSGDGSVHGLAPSTLAATGAGLSHLPVSAHASGVRVEISTTRKTMTPTEIAAMTPSRPRGLTGPSGATAGARSAR